MKTQTITHRNLGGNEMTKVNKALFNGLTVQITATENISGIKNVLTRNCDDSQFESINFSDDEATMMYMNWLASKATAQVISHPTKGKTFREITIEGFRFRGTVGFSGLYIENVISPLHFWDAGSVQLGRVTEIHYCPAIPSKGPCENSYGPGWWICKYGTDEPRVNINGLSEVGRYTLAYEFGIPIYPHSDGQPNSGFPAEWKLPKYLFLPNGDILFFLSHSFNEITDWAKSHHRLIRSKDIKEFYLRGWKKAAENGEYVPDWQGWKGPSIKAA